MLLPWLTLFDLKGVFANFIKPKKLDYKRTSDDFAILVPIFNSTKYLSNLDFLKKYKEKVILCTTDEETEEFYKDLEKISKNYGFKILKSTFKKEPKNPWRIYQKTLLAHDYVLGESVKSLTSKYVIFLDADTTCKTDLKYLAGAFEKENYDLSSVVILPSKKETITENLQYIEYNNAMKSRRIYPWLTSGAAMIAKRESIKEIMKKHSMFFNGGDIEIGKIANLMGMKVGHLPVKFYTDVPETYPKLVKQRFSWFCGAFRHSVVNAHTNLSTPVYSFYFTFLIFLMLPFKIFELILHWYVLPFIILFYILMMFVINWEIRSKYMFLFPFYSLSQVLLFPILGIYRYTTTVIKTKNFGVMKVHYKKDYHPARYALNILIILSMAFVIWNIHLVEGKLFLSNIDLLALVGLNFQDTSDYAIFYNGLGLFLLLTSLFLLFFGVFKTGFYIKDNRKKLEKWIRNTAHLVFNF